MASDDLLGTSDLLNFNNSVIQSDPLNMAGQGLASFQPDMRSWSPSAQGIGAFGKSFLQGFLQNQARANAADQLQSVVNVLPQLRSDPYNVAAPEGVDSDAFNFLKGTAVLKNDALQTNRANALQDLLQKVQIAGATKRAEVLGENAAYNSMGADGELNPKSPAYQVNKDQEDKLVTLRKEFNALDPVKNFAKASQAANALSGALKDNSKVSDQELVRYSILMIEPGMAVREGEQGAVANSQSLPEAWKGQLAGALSGKSALGDDVREGIKNLASRAYTSHKGLYDQTYDLYSKEATQQNLDPSRLSYIGKAPDASSIFGSPATGLGDARSFAQQALASGMTKDQARAAWAAKQSGVVK